MSEHDDKKIANAEAKPARVRMMILVMVGVVAILVVAVATHNRPKVVVVQTISSAGGVQQRVVVMPAKAAGTSAICGGHEVAPAATGCTASGGVIFASPPTVMPKNGAAGK